ncbi:MAG: sugar-binding protein [Phycisphaeraceae bacterium]
MFQNLTRSLALLAVAGVFMTGCGKQPDVAFVTNNPSDFWQIAKAGVQKAEKEFGIVCEIRMPANGTAQEQKQIVEDLIARGIKGMAISPKDSANQTDLINSACAKMNVLCHDSDAPATNRLAYVGSNNVTAGHAAGELVKEILPDGGKIVLFVGSKDAQNAQERIAGLRKAIEGTNIEVVDVRTDETDRVKAQNNVADTITNSPDVKCFVGLWSYNGPAILEAVKKANKLGQIHIVAFDEEDATLQGVKEGHIHATVVQDPYMFGYESVRILAQLMKKEDPKIPANKIIEVPVKKIKKDNVDAYWTELKGRIAAAKKG